MGANVSRVFTTAGVRLLNDHVDPDQRLSQIRDATARANLPKGLTEAGESLGMGKFAVWWNIRMPMALRSIVPPLGNRWIFIMKATTVGVAIGFSDLFYIVSTSITQSGQTLELIAILMSAFLLVNFALAQGINWLNARLALKGYGA